MSGGGLDKNRLSLFNASTQRGNQRDAIDDYDAAAALPGMNAAAAPAKTRQASGQFLGIQYLRGIAALLVVLHHVRNPIEGMFNPIAGYGFGARGVDIFFVISGFIMFTAARDEPVRMFLWRRATRVVPLYWAATFALAAILIATHKFGGGHLRQLVLSLFFVPHFSLDVPGTIIPLLDPGWTLNYEMFFYAIFAIGILTRHVVLTTCAIIMALVAIGLAMAPASAIGITYTHPLLLEFLGGLLIGKLFHDRPIASLGWLVFVGFACLLTIHDGYGGRVIAAGLPALAIVAGTVSADIAGRVPVIPILKRIGDASYSIYLTHYFVLRAALGVWRHLPLAGWPQFIGHVVVGFVASTVVGMLIYTHVERPLTLLFKRWQPARPLARCAA